MSTTDQHRPPATGTLPPKAWWLGVGGAIVCGAIIRLVYLLQIRDNPFFTNLISDAAHFDAWATQIAGGDWLGTGPFFRAPLYAYALGALYRVLERDLLWIRVVQHAIGLVGVLLTARVARRMWDERAGVVAAWVLALYPTAIYYEGEILSDFLLVTVTPLLLLTILDATARRQRGMCVAAGVLTGVFALTRPTILATVPILAGWIVYRDWIGGRRRDVAWKAALYVLGVIALIVPVTARNRIVGGDWVLIAWQGGVNFAVGNHAKADGLSASLPPWGGTWTAADISTAAEKAEGRALRPSQVSDYWTGQGLRFWRDSPGRALGLLGRKLTAFWQNAEYANNQDRGWFVARWGPILGWLPLSFGTVAAFALLGWWAKRDQRDARWALVWSAAYSLAVAAFFVTDRFRLPVVPLWIAAGAGGAVWLADQIRARRWRLSLIGGGVVLIAVVVGRISFFRYEPHSLSRSYLALGNIAMTDGQVPTAIAAYDTALTYDPTLRGAWLSRGAACYRLGSRDSAAASFERALAFFPDDPQALANLAQVRADQGDTLAALGFLDRALSGAGAHDPSAALLKARLLRERGESAAAYDILAPLCGRGDADLLVFAGVLQMETGHLESADSLFGRALSVVGDQRGIETELDVRRLFDTPGTSATAALAHYNRGVVAGFRARWPQAIDELRAAVRFDPRLGEAWSNLSTAYLQVGQVDSAGVAAAHAVEVNPRDPRFLCARAFAALAHGDNVAARADAAAAVAIDPNFPPARSILDQLGP